MMERPCIGGDIRYTARTPFKLRVKGTRMTAVWYYSSDEKKLGPYTQHQLKEFAACGVLLPTDTVWKEGSPTGVLARRVKNLFPHLDAAGASEPPALTPEVAPALVE